MKHIKILFEHENDIEDGFGIESAWAIPLDNGTYKLDNILFYALEYSLDDIVSIENRDGEFYVNGLVEESGNSTVRIIFNHIGDVEFTREKLRELGCDSEISNNPILIAINIPKSVRYNKIKEILDIGETEEKWSYEESCIAHKE